MSILRAKKTLGQHFLKSKSILEKIVAAGKVTPEDTALEIGPGEGNLTQKILEKVGKVIAVEKDDRLIPYLREKFTTDLSTGRLSLVHADILNFNPVDYKLKAKSYKLIANLPYYITGKFLRKFLTADQKPSLAVLMLQKEVAERIVARNGKESILSLSVKAFGEPKLVAVVSKRYFSPQPKVDSAILLIDRISNKIPKESEDVFFKLVKVGFSSKRKKLFNNILPLTKDKETLARAFQTCEIEENSRAENLSLETWMCLTQELSSIV